jgi:hypothetical protein
MRPLELDFPQAGAQRHADHGVKDVREVRGTHRHRCRELAERLVLPDVRAEKDEHLLHRAHGRGRGRRRRAAPAHDAGDTPPQGCRGDGPLQNRTGAGQQCLPDQTRRLLRATDQDHGNPGPPLEHRRDEPHAR